MAPHALRVMWLQDKIEELQNKLTVLQAQRTQLTSRSHMLATARQVLCCSSRCSLSLQDKRHTGSHHVAQCSLLHATFGPDRSEWLIWNGALQSYTGSVKSASDQNHTALMQCGTPGLIALLQRSGEGPWWSVRFVDKAVYVPSWVIWSPSGGCFEAFKAQTLRLMLDLGYP